MGKAATVIVPTTKDRGPLLPYSIGSILNQTVKDIEVFIIGDGVYEETRKIIHELIEKDKRIRFFDHPKHERRGEPYRHKALQYAKGKIICYLCDRDLMLPFHIENLMSYYESSNMVTTQCFSCQRNGSVIIAPMIYEGKISKQLQAKEAAGKVLNFYRGFFLSTLSHSMELYDKLPFGWRTTPKGYFTDQFMYDQLLSNENCNPFFSIYPPSIIYIKRGNHEKGWPTEKRLKDLAHWYNFIQKESCLSELKELALKGLFRQRNSFLKNQKIFNLSAFILLVKRLTRFLR